MREYESVTILSFPSNNVSLSVRFSLLVSHVKALNRDLPQHIDNLYNPAVHF